MTEFFMSLSLLQYAALGGAVVLLAPVVWDGVKAGVKKLKGVKLPSRKLQAPQPNVCFSQVMEIRALLAKDGNEEVLEAYDSSVVPTLVRVLAKGE